LARQHEKRGRKWLVVSYVFCPCHLPIVLMLLGAAFGGTALGATVSGNALGVGIALTAVYGVVLWRGFRQIRWAKRIEAAGGTLSCSPEGCTVTAARRCDWRSCAVHSEPTVTG
jgi:ABC-type nickel/cobalt efflux system permease component RcnA